MRHAILLAVLLAGCRQDGAPLANPFLGPSRVAPPATRTPPPGAAVPYYDGASAPPAAAPGAWQSGENDTTRPAEAGSSFAGAPAGGPAAIEMTGPSPGREQIAIPSDDHRERLVRAAISADADESTMAGRAPRPFPDIADLPQVTATSTNGDSQTGSSPGRRGSGASDAFRPRNARSRPEEVGQVQTASFEAPAIPNEPSGPREDEQDGSLSVRSRQRFAYASDYRWLQGRLEYSQASDQWKLRYIPIDGATDDYGGSVIVANPEALGDLAEGDFVRVEGTHREGQGGGVSFAPFYRVQQIVPLPD